MAGVTWVAVVGALVFTAMAGSLAGASPGGGAGGAPSAFTDHGGSHTVRFSETGLPHGTSWCVFLESEQCAARATITVKGLATGTYAYTIAPPVGYSASVRMHGAPAPRSGWVTVASPDPKIATHFTQVTYLLTINASGLAPGKAWSVSVQGLFHGHSKVEIRRTTANATTFEVPNGTFNLSVGPEHGYVTLGPTSFSVAGGASSLNIAYVKIRLIVASPAA